MLEGKRILLGVSGGIAAYKAAELVRLFIKAGASVQVVMTANAQRFITPLTLQVLSGHSVGTDLFDPGFESQVGHIETSRAADIVVIAPATANVMAKMAAGIADDFLTTVLLAATVPVLVCPAMNVRMWENAATRRNLDTLLGLGIHVCGPDCGFLACKEEGSGRLVDLPVIVEEVRRLLTPPSLAGRRVLVSAGPTWEHFDPVRFISNPSTGKMGYALAAVAARRGAEVVLVSGPCSLPDPQRVTVERVTSAAEMCGAVHRLAPAMDAIVMSAAVSDYTPESRADQKLKKLPGDLTVTLKNTTDILASLGRLRGESPRPVLVGFAAETEHLEEHARQKLVRKNADFIVANNLTVTGSGFGTDTNQVKVVDRGGDVTEYPSMSKEAVACMVWDRTEQLLGTL